MTKTPTVSAPGRSPWNLKLFRFEFDNDSYIGSDDAFSAGWSFQVHSRLMDEWNPAFAGWIGRHLGFGEPPQGWDNQLSTRILANLNYEYRYKLYNPAVSSYLPGRFAGDFSVGGEAAAGNRTTRLNIELEARFEWGLSMGFTKNPDPPGIGIVLDPVYFDPEQPLQDLKRWRIYFNLMARRHWITYLTAAEGGPTESGYNHPPLRPYPGEKELMLGMHLIRAPFGLHLSYYRYMGALPESVSSTPDWVNFSFEYRF